SQTLCPSRLSSATGSCSFMTPPGSAYAATGRFIPSRILTGMIEKDATAAVRHAMPLCETLGIRADEYSGDGVVLSLDWSESLCTSNGVLHGGAIMALADSAGGACALLNLPAAATRP